MSGIFSGSSVIGTPLARGENQAPYIGCCVGGVGAVTDAQLSQDDVNTMSAAMTQAAATGKNVTVKLSDGTTYTATPSDLSDSASGSLPMRYLVIGGASLAGVGVLYGLSRLFFKRPKKNPRRRHRARRRSR